MEVGLKTSVWNAGAAASVWGQGPRSSLKNSNWVAPFPPSGRRRGFSLKGLSMSASAARAAADAISTCGFEKEHIGNFSVRVLVSNYICCQSVQTIGSIISLKLVDINVVVTWLLLDC